MGLTSKNIKYLNMQTTNNISTLWVAFIKKVNKYKSLLATI